MKCNSCTDTEEEVLVEEAHIFFLNSFGAYRLVVIYHTLGKKAHVGTQNLGACLLFLPSSGR